MNFIFQPGKLLIVAAGIVMLPAVANAQDNTLQANTVTVGNVIEANDAATYDTTTTTTTKDRDDDNDFPWGLLGLAGLAGLLGLKRHDDARDIHVDARRDKRP